MKNFFLKGHAGGSLKNTEFMHIQKKLPLIHSWLIDILFFSKLPMRQHSLDNMKDEFSLQPIILT